MHHLTNWVTIYDCAQATRAVGALPVMAHAHEEVEEMTGLASSLVLNIGTLTAKMIKSMLLAGKAANKRGVPVILDAVGCGATKLRTDSTLKIMKEVKVDVLKGNAGEISIAAGSRAKVRGVESMGVEGDIKALAKNLAAKYNNVVVVTGKEDVISDGDKLEICREGDEMMGRVVGTGCMAASVLGCFTAVGEDMTEACRQAMDFYGRAGRAAAEKTQRPMEFKMNLIDNLAE